MLWVLDAPSHPPHNRFSGPAAHRWGARLMPNRRCLVEVPNAPRHRAERAYAEVDYNEETALENSSNPGHCARPADPTDA